MGYHLRKGRFGKKEQHMERKLIDYLRDIERCAEGRNIGVRRFTMKNNGRILDTERLKSTANRMVELDTEITDKEEREFYISFFYCVLALTSTEFTYIPDDDPETEKHSYDFPKSFQYITGFTMEMLDKTFLFEEIGVMYYLLSGERMEFYIEDDISDVEFSPEEQQEHYRDLEESMADYDYEADMREWAEYMAEYDAWVPMSMEEARECNRTEGKKIMAFFPGYEDYLKYAKKLEKLFEKYYDGEKFEKDVNKMTSEFLLAEGFSIFSDEKKYLEVMVQLNRTKKLLAKHMGDIVG